MPRQQILTALGAIALAGCYYSPPPSPPPQRVVQREVVDQNGNVIQRETVIEDGGPVPAPQVEVIPIRPYPTAIWIRGYWFRDRYHHRWVWVDGHWR